MVEGEAKPGQNKNKRRTGQSTQEQTYTEKNWEMIKAKQNK